MGPQDSLAVLVLLTAYQSARTELIDRIKQRDTVVRIYLTVLALIFGALTVSPNDNSFSVQVSFGCLISCLFGLSASQSVANHQMKIASIGYYIEMELMPQFSSLKTDICISDWEVSEANKHYSHQPLIFHQAYFNIIFLVPQIIASVSYAAIAVIYPDRMFRYGSLLVFVFLLLQMVCVSLSAWVMRQANKTRTRLNKRRGHVAHVPDENEAPEKAAPE